MVDCKLDTSSPTCRHQHYYNEQRRSGHFKLVADLYIKKVRRIFSAEKRIVGELSHGLSEIPVSSNRPQKQHDASTAAIRQPEAGDAAGNGSYPAAVAALDSGALLRNRRISFLPQLGPFPTS
jgi:hypothetical protein